MSMSDQQTMFIFPGQGSQYVGMGSDIYEAFAPVREIYEQANDILGFDIQKLSFEGPAEQLDKTRFTQPALLTHSIACLEAFKSITDNQIKPAYAAGHSLGEYSALVASGVLSFETALRLVQRRGELMGTFGRGKMMAFRADLETVRPFADNYYCGIGGCNLPEQTVVGGTEEDLAAMAEYAATLGHRGIPLNTEGAFHTYLMVTAAEAFRPDLDAATFNAPACKVMSNYTGDYHTDNTDSIKSALFFQLFNPVKWIWSIERAINDGVDFIIEFGGGIGKGEGPAEKRPNLQSITKRAYKGLDKTGVYHPAINLPTLEKTTNTILTSA
ncbi:MAG: ACP S-malonyltransferase [Bacteroidota bacterium]